MYSVQTTVYRLQNTVYKVHMCLEYSVRYTHSNFSNDKLEHQP